MLQPVPFNCLAHGPGFEETWGDVGHGSVKACERASIGASGPELSEDFFPGFVGVDQDAIAS